MDSYLDDELLLEFINECREHLATIEADLLTIEEGGSDIDEELVNKVFRAAHSIKGGSSFFGLNLVKELAHKAETVLDMLRSRKIVPNAEVTNILLAAFDQLREMIERPNESESADIADLLVSLTGLASSYLPAEQKASLHQQVTLASPGGPVVLARTDFDRAVRSGQYIYVVEFDLIHDMEKKGKEILPLFNSIAGTGEILDCIVDMEAVGTLDGPVGNRIPMRLVLATILDPGLIDGLFETLEPEKIHLLLDPETSTPAPDDTSPKPTGEETAEPVQEPPPLSTKPSEPQPLRHEKDPSRVPRAALSGGDTSAVPKDETLRIHVGLLENLMNLAGELVLSRNQLRSAVAQDNRQLIGSVAQRVNQVTSELQDVIMQTRLQPIGNVFGKFPRMIRDLSRSLGKEIQLEIEGKEVALDKTLIEGLSDPLTHMVRNAVDHGIETSEARLAAGKEPGGTVRIEARHEAGQVVVDISDDGKGLDPQGLADAAVRKGLISREKAAGLSDADKRALIFLPGFSTAGQVSDLSGRGVGMDVVKTNLDRLGGQVGILSEAGKGSTFRIRLPLTLAIVPSLIFSVENERFAIPQANIEELLRLRPEEVKNRIEIVGDSEVLILRDRVLPLARFADIIGAVPTYMNPKSGAREVDRRVRLSDRRCPKHSLTDTPLPEKDAAARESYPPRSEGRRQAAASALEIAVVTTGTFSYGLVVGAFYDTEEVVVKPLGQRLKHLREYFGATILGDGSVALILDMSGLAAKAGLVSVSGSARAAALTSETEHDADAYALLLFHNGPKEACGVPLNLVQRIERISPVQVERLGNQRTMQYRGKSLPLFALSDSADVASVEDEEEPVVLVSSVNGREFGILGTMPVDVIDTRVVIDHATHRQKGIVGSAVLQGRTTFIVDPIEMISTEVFSGVAAPENARGAVTGDVATVLLAEDSDFFRSQVKKYLEEEGYSVLTAADGEEAWSLLLKHMDTVRAVVTDIEMPRLSGLELTARIRAETRTEKLPVIALTSLAGDADRDRGREAGITEYQVKLDRDSLIVSLRDHLGMVE